MKRYLAAFAATATLAALLLARADILPPQRGQAATLTSGGYTTDGSVAPASVARGATVGVTASVTSTSAGAALVDIEVYDPSGTKVHQQAFDNQTFAANQTRTFTTSYAMPATAATGAYSVRVGIFAPGWASLRHWNANAASFTVTAGGAAPTNTPPAAGATPTPVPGSGTLPALPAGWPATLQIGSADSPGGAQALKNVAPFAFRYQYLAGGVNTGNGWANWNANGSFVTNYVQESVSASIIPAFTYYMIFQSAPGNAQGEADGVYNNLQNTSTMTSYYNDLKLFFQRAGAFPGNKVVLHVEPDLWGYIQQRASNDNATTVPTKVSATGMPELAGLPDNFQGFARAIDKLRDAYAPNVILGYHISTWGTGNDIVYTNPNDATLDQLGTRAANWFNSLGGGFDIAFAEYTDRDAAFKQYQYSDGGAAWYDAGDYSRFARFLGKFVSVAGKRVVLWQIPLGNTKMRAVNNTWNHYQDNKVEWLLDDATRTNLDAYRRAGVVAFLFGRGADGATCACDANNDGVTNPAPINGNNGTSLNADDDGGYFKQRVQAYYAAGAMPLSGGGAPPPTPTPAPPTSTPTRTPAGVPPTSTPTRTPAGAPPTSTPTRTATPSGSNPTATATPAVLSFTTSATASPGSVARGATVSIAATVRASRNANALVDIEVYNANGVKVWQKFWDAQAFTAGVNRTFNTSWRPPAGAVSGTYTVRVGVFAPGWASLYHWNGSAATFVVP